MRANTYLLLITALIAFGMGCDAMTDDSFRMEVAGTITSRLDGAPVQNAIVTLSGSFPPAFGSITDVSHSDADGKYAISLQIEEGCPKFMSFHVKRIGYVGIFLDVAPVSSSPAVLCRSGKQIYDIVLDERLVIESVEPSAISSTSSNVSILISGHNFDANTKVLIGEIEWIPAFVEDDGTSLVVNINATRLEPNWYDVTVFYDRQGHGPDMDSRSFLRRALEVR